jgi:hypothetical protein
MTTSLLASPAIAAFAAQVRAALDDLPTDEVDDLTDGLEADLAERAADLGNDELGDPAAYADELRGAAGLPPRRARARAKGLDTVIARAARQAWAELRQLYDHPAIRQVGSFLVALRPLWWLFRAWAIYCIVVGILHLPTFELSLLTFIVGAASLILSVQWGRGKWLPRTWIRRVFIGLNVLLVLCIPIVVIATLSAIGQQSASASSAVEYAPDGLSLNGKGIHNIFAYDENGNPLKNVQLFDQDGKPLIAVPDSALTYTDGWGAGANQVLVPNYQGRSAWNVYPLLHVSQQWIHGDQVSPNAHPKPVRLPFAKANPLLQAPTPTATPTPTPTATPAP